MGKRSQRRHGASESRRRILCRAQLLGRCSTTHPEAWFSVQARGARENSTQREASGTEPRRQAAVAKPRDETHLLIWRGGCEPGGEAEWTRGADGVRPVAQHDHSCLAPLLNREDPLGPITRSLASERPQRAETHETPKGRVRQSQRRADGHVLGPGASTSRQRAPEGLPSSSGLSMLMRLPAPAQRA